MKSFKKEESRWWFEHKRKSRIFGCCDDLDISSFLNDIKKINNSQRKGLVTFEMALNMEPWRKKDASHAMVARALANGHVDASIWVNLRLRRFDRKSREFVILENSNSSWMMDLDGLDKAFGKEFCNCEKVVDLFKQRGVLVPSYIVQTGEYNFHVVYYGQSNFWDQDKIDSVVLKFAGLPKKPNDSKILDQRLRNVGIDPCRYRVNPIYHQIRIPGSVKYKPDYGLSFVCKKWENPFYNFKNPFNPFNREFKQKDFAVCDVEEKEFIVQANKKTAFQVYEKNIEIVRREVLKVLGKGRSSKRVIEYISNNIGLLKKGELAFHQEGLAESWRVSQPTVSRLLKILRDEGILKKETPHTFVSAFHYANKATEYRLGPKLELALGINNNKKTSLGDDKKRQLIDILSTGYERKMTNSAFCQDLRIAYSLGVNKNDFVELAVHKFSHVRYPSRLRPRHIENAWDNWDAKFNSGGFNYRRFSRPVIDISKIIEGFV